MQTADPSAHGRTRSGAIGGGHVSPRDNLFRSVQVTDSMKARVRAQTDLQSAQLWWTESDSDE